MHLRSLRLALPLLFFGCSDPAGLLDVEARTSFVIPELTDEAQVLRTEMDVPHVYAKNRLDMHRVQGFVTARDRFVQIELLRRFGSGTVAELLGDLGTAIDQQSRGRGLRYVGDRLWEFSGPEIQAMFTAYAEGVNAYVRALKRGQFPLPEELEFVASFRGLDNGADVLEPMTGKDVAYVAAVIVSRLGFEEDDVLAADAEAQIAKAFADGPLAELRRAGLSADIWEAVAPIHAISQIAPGTVTGPGSPLLAKQAPSIRTPWRPGASLPEELSARIAKQSQSFMRWLRKPSGVDFGSNAWAVSSKGTGGQGSLLANDGHLSLSVPSLFYQMCVDSKYLGDGDYKACGLFFPGLPLFTVGTNGKVAWGQTYLNADVTDWYREELELDAKGRPKASLFQGSMRPLVVVEEEYRIAAQDEDESPTSETWARYETFDGRWILSVEGDVLTATGAAGREDVIAVDGELVHPRDTDGDGVVSAVSFDWTAFDVTTTLRSVDAFVSSEDIAEFESHTRDIVAYSQNIIVADDQGEIMFTGYHPMPCREYLTKDERGWAPGANPRRLLDGTRFGGFTVDADSCVIPYEAGPRRVSPEVGYVHTANHDPLGNGFDDSLANDEFYIGGPYSLGYRAKLIDEALAPLVASESASLDTMSEVQGLNRSATAPDFLPHLFAALDRAANTEPSTETEARLSALYTARKAQVDEARARLEAWLEGGAPARSGVDTFYASPSAAEKTDAVATMIYNAWLRAMFEGVFDDEAIDFVWQSYPERMRFRALHRFLDGRGPDNPRGLASYNPTTLESAFFDVRGTEIVETSDEIIVEALTRAFAALEAPSEAEDGGFGTSDMDAWLWGLKHQVRFESLIGEIGAGNPALLLLASQFALTTEDVPLADDIPPGDPRADLTFFPRDGDFFGVDAGFPSMLARRWYTYAHGPVMRMVIALDDGKVTGRNILPGGQSGRKASPHFADQVKLWLQNETIPMRFYAEDVAEGAVDRERFVAER